MKVLLFGASGQLGRAIIASAPRECDISAPDRTACDLRDAAAIAALIMAFRPELIVNAAAYTAVDAAESDAAAAAALNAHAPAVMADAARKAGARLIHISTDFVFDGMQPTPRRPNDPTSPIGVYGRTKRDGEEAVLRADPESLVLRTAWLYDAHGRNFVNTMLRLISERREVRVVADQVGTPTRALSLARAVWSLAASPAHGIHHYTDAGLASWYDFAVAIAEEASMMSLIDQSADLIPVTTADYPTPARRPAFSVLDKTDTWALLAAPAPHWRTNLRESLRELSSNA